MMHGVMHAVIITIYSGTPFERPPWREATPSGKATWQCKSKLKCIDFYPWREATPLEKPLFWCKQGGLTRGVPLYLLIYEDIHGIFEIQIQSYNINAASLYLKTHGFN